MSKPADFVDILNYIPSVQIDVRYFGSDNFVGTPIDGYEAEKILLTITAAQALSMVQADLAASGLGLKVFDGYRPQRAVDHFVRWAEDLDELTMKSRYYPGVDKENLFRDGYIAARSGHSRGGTVDITLVSLSSGMEVDMGSAWDFFDPISWPSSEAVAPEQSANRILLQTIMMKHGFNPLMEEWWHFTFSDELFPDSYFDFPIE